MWLSFISVADNDDFDKCDITSYFAISYAVLFWLVLIYIQSGFLFNINSIISGGTPLFIAKCNGVKSVSVVVVDVAVDTASNGVDVEVMNGKQRDPQPPPFVNIDDGGCDVIGIDGTVDILWLWVVELVIVLVSV